MWLIFIFPILEALKKDSSSLLQTGDGMTTFLSAVTPPGMAGVVGPALALATAKAYAKKGISDIFVSGLDYPWVCPCKGFTGVTNTTSEAKKCPVDSSLGCYTT
jgi:hypothetical protein